ncbi:MAG: DUF4154 domain-containing protein [Deltaproteobacteria bacterium]|nr:DUF4154 domain-containing protein [Deltaproteobacteria bacterium]
MIFFKIMTYDGNLPADDALRVGIVYPAAKKTDDELAAVERAFDKFASMTVKGRKIEVVRLGYRSAGELESLAKSKKLYALFLMNAVPASDVGALKKISAVQQLFTFAVEPELVKAGIGAGVAVVDRKPQIVVNLTAMDAAGRKIDTALLKLCQIVR